MTSKKGWSAKSSGCMLRAKISGKFQTDSHMGSAKIVRFSNIYGTKTYRGQRLQKFVYKGFGPVTKADQGVLWPAQK
jgi:hypothetical protein